MFDSFQQLLTRISAIDPFQIIIEIVLIWLVVWLIFGFLKDTRGARVLKGVGLVLIVIGAVLVLTKDQEFQRLGFLFRNFLTFATFALVIVFQPELRRALIRLGEARLFRGIPGKVETVLEEVIKSISSLSNNKIGAIIAIERDVPLGGIVDAGIQLNADVSSELILTIFWPGSALHDMGIVIRDEKILAAGVQFPLTDSEDISQELGSRHRAAIGLSQEADCFVIVVSEETGIISLAERGQLIRKLSPEALRAILRRGLVETAKTSGLKREYEADYHDSADVKSSAEDNRDTDNTV